MADTATAQSEQQCNDAGNPMTLFAATAYLTR